MPVRAIGIALSLAGVLATGAVHAGRIRSVDITLQATVTRVIGGGSFTTPTPGGGTKVRDYQVTEIPNFFWQVGRSFGLQWTLTPAELAFLHGDEFGSPCLEYPHFQFAGTSPPASGGPLHPCDGKLTEERPFIDVFEFEDASRGPSVDLLTRL